MINVNLIAERERQRKLGEAAGRIAFFVAVLLFVLTMLAVTLQQTRLRAARNTLHATEGEIARLQDQKTEIDTLQDQIDGKKPLVDLLRRARDSEAKWCNALTHISDAVPPGAALIGVRSSDSLQPKVKDESQTQSKQPVKYEGFTISGEAATGDKVGQFITNLQNTESFGDVYAPSVRRRKGRNDVEMFQFDIQALLATKERSAP